METDFVLKRAMVQEKAIPEITQYGLGKILLIYIVAAGPMAIMGWIVAPTFSHGSASPGVVRVAALTAGLLWQFALVLILLAAEGCSLRWSDIRQRLWLQPPSSETGGRINRRLWWWLVPIMVLTTLYEMQVGGAINHLWVSVFPFLAEPPGLDMSSFVSSPEAKAQLVGAWGVYALFIVSAVLNTVVGEELLFRGVLLPRMAGTFGKWDWLANGFLFGFYHWHQPWMMLSAAIEGALLFSLPSRRFRCSWFGIIAHSGQSILFAFLFLGLILGLA